VIRNAAAHGKINIRNPNAPAVSWRDLSYSFADNGKRIFGAEFHMGEAIALMLESSEALDKLNAPVL
jgi:hypothetical protein